MTTAAGLLLALALGQCLPRRSLPSLPPLIPASARAESLIAGASRHRHRPGAFGAAGFASVAVHVLVHSSSSLLTGGVVLAIDWRPRWLLQ
jgi:hypothetical protein